MSHLLFGPLLANVPRGPMRRGQVVGGHAHHFDHPTCAINGAITVAMLGGSMRLGADGWPIQARWSKDGWPPDDEIEVQHLIDSRTDRFAVLVPRGRWHALRAETDGAQYVCWYPHLAPQPIALERPGAMPRQKPWTMRDADGALWARIDEAIVTDACGWADAYR